jgi:hypothetical protein
MSNVVQNFEALNIDQPLRKRQSDSLSQSALAESINPSTCSSDFTPATMATDADLLSQMIFLFSSVMMYI